MLTAICWSTLQGHSIIWSSGPACPRCALLAGCTSCAAGTTLLQVSSFLGPGIDFIAKSEVGGRAAWTLQDAHFGVIRSASDSKARGAAQAHRK